VLERDLTKRLQKETYNKPPATFSCPTKETYAYENTPYKVTNNTLQKRPTHTKIDLTKRPTTYLLQLLCVTKETYEYEKRPTHIKESYAYEKRPHKETYNIPPATPLLIPVRVFLSHFASQKRHTYMKRDLRI